MMFKKFMLEDLFEFSVGDVDLQQKDINGNGDFFINSGLSNRGIKGKTDRQAKIFPENTITVDFWGNAYYRDFQYKLATHNHVFSLSGPVIKDKKVGLYLEGLLSRLPALFSYNNMATPNKLKTLEINLPVVESANPDHEYTVDDIDYEYMRDRITELERDRITELDAYLKTAGLDDYELTDADKKILSLSQESASDEADGLAADRAHGEVIFSSFPITDVFDIRNTKCVMKSQTKSKAGGTPYLTASSANNAVGDYISCNKDLIDEGNCIFIGGKTMVVSYQERDFVSNDSHNLALYLKNEKKRTRRIQHYLCTAVDKALSQKYYWGDSISWKKIQSDSIRLPVTKEGHIDFDYMERYIQAIEKLIVADMVRYKDKLTKTTKHVVNA